MFPKNPNARHKRLTIDFNCFHATLRPQTQGSWDIASNSPNVSKMLHIDDHLTNNNVFATLIYKDCSRMLPLN